MHKLGISVFAILVAIPAFSAGNLPIVNIGAASVSARAAFGEDVVPQSKSKGVSVVSNIKPVIPNPEPLALSADVLMPKRPSDDLWARATEQPLRLPQPNEIVVLGNDFVLPEETLAKKETNVAMANRPSEIQNQKSEKIDTEIARLVELQRKADENIKNRKEQFVESKKKIDTTTVNHKPSTFAQMSPSELKRAFKKTYMSENKHLSTYKIDDRFDVASDVITNAEGFSSVADLSEAGGVRPLEIKISFRDTDSALSRDNYNLLSEYASIVVSNPKRAIQISIPENATHNADDRKLAARRLTIVEQVLRDTGVSDARIMPVLAQRGDSAFVLRVISSDQFQTLTQQKRDMFGDTTSKKTYKSMSW